MVKRVLFFLTSFSIGVFLFIWVIRFIGWEEVKSVFFTFSRQEGLIILGLTFATMIVSLIRWRSVLRSQGYNVPIIGLFRPFLVCHAVTYLTPTVPFGGDVLAGYIVKEKLKLPLKVAVSSAIIDQILEVTSHLIVILLGVIYFLFKIGLPPRDLIIILGGGFLIALTLLSFFYLKSFRKESLVKIFFKKREESQFLEIEKEVFQFFSLKNFNFWKGLALSFLREGVSFCRSFILIFFLSGSLNFFPALSVFSFSTLVQLFPVPANLGSHEIIQTFVFSSLGMAKGIAPAFTIIIRGAELFLSFIGVIFLFGFGRYVLGGFIFKENNKELDSIQ